MLDENNNVFAGSYNRWRETRVRKLEQLFGSDWFKGKHVLELACAYGNIGLYLKNLGAIVTFADARQEHLDVVLEKDPTATTVLLDQDTNWDLNRKFDLILHFGVLYHINNWQQDLKSTLQHAPLVILESAVAKTSQYFDFKLHEESEGGQNAFNGIGSMLSATTIESYLISLGHIVERHDDPALNTRRYFYDWVAEDVALSDITVSSFEDEAIYGGRRFWVIKKP